MLSLGLEMDPPLGFVKSTLVDKPCFSPSSRPDFRAREHEIAGERLSGLQSSMATAQARYVSMFLRGTQRFWIVGVDERNQERAPTGHAILSPT